MADEPNQESPRTRKKSVKGYASKLFKESSVTAVSAIVSTGNVPRKVFRVVVFLLFTAGFLYQCIKFLSYILEHPTVVNIEIDKPQSYLAPAYTFCNYNIIKRSKFCAKYPDRCMTPDEEFCDWYPNYCGENITKVPKENSLQEVLKSFEDIIELGHHWRDFVKFFPGNYELEGPFARLFEEENTIAACYSVNDHVDNSLSSVRRNRKMFHQDSDRFTFNPEENELFYPNGKAGIIFAIHSPFEAINPFIEGIFMKPGYRYRIKIQMQEERLLPHPYKTDCFNYTESWLKANKTGPRAQVMCRYRCIQKSFVECTDCIHPFILYPGVKRYCTYDELNYTSSKSSCLEGKTDVVENCINMCKDDCVRTKFTYNVHESYFRTEMENYTKPVPSREIVVNVYFEDTEILRIQYKPQFQEVEAFSYIGGFIGIWLGVSLVQVVDVFESVFLITRYFFKKGTSLCSRESTTNTQSEAV